MKATFEINDSEFDKLIKQNIDEALSKINIEQLIESKIQNKVGEALKKSISDAKIDNMARDRVSRIITSESLKDFTFGIDTEGIYSNLEAKILIMISKSAEFKKIVKFTLKSSL